MRDRFGREHVYLRVALTDYCNLNCSYCRPSGVAAAPPRALPLSVDELERLIRVFARLGIRKVRLTGGEPTVRPDLLEIVRRLGRIPGIETLALTTNGVHLAGLAAPLRDAGLEKLNVSLDSLRPERFRAITGRDKLGAVLGGIEAALVAGFEPLKVNVVVIRGLNDDELLDFVALGRSRAINVRFIEYMPFRENGWSREGLVPFEEMRERIAVRHPLTQVGHGERTGGVAQDFVAEGHAGRISFITPISEDFCGRCNRLRVTADGRLKACLFSPAGAELAGALRRGADESELSHMILSALEAKAEAHPAAEELCSRQDQAMNVIGG
jgi:GTP 3',8-cyclase